MDKKEETQATSNGNGLCARCDGLCPSCGRIKEEQQTIEDTIQHLDFLFSKLFDILDFNDKEVLTKDDLYNDVELLCDNFQYLQQLSILPDDFEGKEKVGKWLKTLNQMEAGDEIDKDQARQMAFDLESSYAAFNSVLSRM